MLEKWKPIKGYERYEISSIGNVRNSKTGGILKKDKSRKNKGKNI